MIDWITKIVTAIFKNERLAEYKMLVEELRLSRAEYKTKYDEQAKRIDILEDRIREQGRVIANVMKMEEKCLHDQVKLQQYVHDLREYIIFKGGDFKEFRK